ncbi:cytochrome d ubiquinol oxidase subunit II [Streptomyces atriruber]|uniref:cytochrome d ubiquinol oxidase subunit II n=1 Tax=Streptomyces atriruber TaxID=545121 RepID=UPI0006E35EBB|nr:cytochrome d ubiquinol oxidase subunit II [Streptomyces atriruber]
MSLETVWLALLGLLLAGYFVLGGYDYGAQMLHPFLGRDGQEEKRTSGNAALDAIAPFFLGNEVWLVAFAGVMFGAFPHLEGTLLSGMYPLIVAILAGLVLGNAAVQLRRRSRSARGRGAWDVLIVVGGAVPAVCWGLVVGLLLHGVPRRADGSFHIGFGEVFSPFVLACGVTTALLFAVHGATFVALRSGPELAAKARKTAANLLVGVAAVGALALLLTIFGAGADMTNRTTSWIIAALIVAALAAAWWYLSQGHNVLAFAATCCATALPVLLLGAGHYPYLLTTGAGAGLDIDHAITDDATLKILSGFGVLVIPTILAYQFWSWWAFRGRTGQRHPSYF